MKVHIRVPCSFCDGEAYLPVRETVSCTGERYTQHRRCAYCLGSGEQDKWVSLREFADLLDRTIGIEPDRQELARICLIVPMVGKQYSRTGMKIW